MQAFVIAADPDERDLISFALRHAGLAVAPGSELRRILNSWEENPADLIILAAEETGSLQAEIAGLRAVTDVPLIVVVDPASEGQLAAWVRTGADLAMERPVSLRLFSEYALGLLRRNGATASFSVPRLELEGITLDPGTRTVSVEGKEPRRLTQLEFRLLHVLVTNREQVVPTEAIVERVWGYSGEGDRDLVRGLVSRLRHKIEPDPEKPRFIQTVAGVGYQFTREQPA
ncbi:MAG: response regulator transcription factor [Anaerolineales bacterium]|nr:response regulator transcription factor [Anaerolineales bacterium]